MNPENALTRVEQTRPGLIPYLSATALEEDYAVAAQRRSLQGGEQGPAWRSRVRVAVVLGLSTMLMITVASNTSRDAGTEEQQRQALVAQVTERRAALRDQLARVAALREETRLLERSLLRSNSDSGGVLAQLTLVGIRSGAVAVRGPGVEVVVDDAPNARDDRNRVLDSDLQALVNGLWEAGAEAIAINGKRLTALSAIRHAGSAITVNYTSLSRPYRVLAIGDPQTLPSRFADSTSGQTWLDLQREVGLRFTMRGQSSIRLPGRGVPTLRFVDLEGTGKESP